MVDADKKDDSTGAFSKESHINIQLAGVLSISPIDEKNLQWYEALSLKTVYFFLSLKSSINMIHTALSDISIC